MATISPYFSEILKGKSKFYAFEIECGAKIEIRKLGARSFQCAILEPSRKCVTIRGRSYIKTTYSLHKTFEGGVKGIIKWLKANVKNLQLLTHKNCVYYIELV